jgi:hypothetical protein
MEGSGAAARFRLAITGCVSPSPSARTGNLVKKTGDPELNTSCNPPQHLLHLLKTWSYHRENQPSTLLPLCHGHQPEGILSTQYEGSDHQSRPLSRTVPGAPGIGADVGGAGDVPFPKQSRTVYAVSKLWQEPTTRDSRTSCSGIPAEGPNRVREWAETTSAFSPGSCGRCHTSISRLVACRREIVSTDAAGGIRVFPLEWFGIC